jgi:hypothetical protein
MRSAYSASVDGADHHLLVEARWPAPAWPRQRLVALLVLGQHQGQLDLRHVPVGRQRQRLARGLDGGGHVAGLLRQPHAHQGHAGVGGRLFLRRVLRLRGGLQLPHLDQAANALQLERERVGEGINGGKGLDIVGRPEAKEGRAGHAREPVIIRDAPATWRRRS